MDRPLLADRPATGHSMGVKRQVHIAQPAEWDSADLLVLLADDASVERRFKDDARSTVTAVRHDDRLWVVKRLHVGIAGRLVYERCRLGPAWREHRGAAKLLAAGVRAVAPAAVGGVGRDAVLIVPYVEGPSLYYYLYFECPPPHRRDEARRSERRRIVRRVGEQIGRMTAAGLTNRDHKPSNLMIDATCRSGDAQPMLIDCGSVRRRSARRIDRMLVNFMKSIHQAGGFTEDEWLACFGAIVDAAPLIAPDGQSLYARIADLLGPPPPRDALPT